MAGGILSFEVKGQDAVTMGMSALLDAMQDLRPFWRDVWAPKYYATVQDLFKTGGAARGEGGRFAGGNWKWLTPKYRIWKQKHYPDRPILVRTGRLMRSVRWEGGQPGPDGIFVAKTDYVVASTRVPYAKFHQHGTKKMVARPFMPPPDPKVFAPLLQQWLMKSYDTKGKG